MILSKKGEGASLATESLIKLILVAMCLIFFTGIIVYACTILTTSSAEKHAKMYFDVFSMRINNMIDFTPNQNYVYTTPRLVVPEGYYVVGFNEEESIDVNIDGNSETWFKPKKCDAFESCLCLYDKKPETTRDKKNKHVVKCNRVPAYTISTTSLMNKPENINPNFIFLGADQIGRFLQIYNNYKSVSYDSRHSLPLTKELGFKNRNLFSFAIRLKDDIEQDSSVFSFYAEKIIMPDVDNKILILLSPYSTDYIARKYYIHKYDSDDGNCNQNNLNEVFEHNPTTNITKYCTYDWNDASKLSLVTHNISLCSQGPVYFSCICGDRVTNYGYCKVFENEQSSHRMLTTKASQTS